MSRVYDHHGVVLHRGDCLDVLSTLGDASVDSVVTDPPYALEFMGKTWDKYTPASYQAWCEKWATECLRVLKPGGHLLAFGGTRTAHRLVCGIEDAGFELRDTITWMYSSGFPKSRDIGKDIDKMADAEAAKQWDGWGTALKPASEPIIVARKPFKGTVAQNVLTHGTGGMNIDGCRVTTMDNLNGGAYSANGRAAPMSGDQRTGAALGMFAPGQAARTDYQQPDGRWPSNLVLSHASTVDGEDACADGCVPGCPVAELDAQSGTSASSSNPDRFKGLRKFTGNAYASDDYTMNMTGGEARVYGDSGGASRFYPVFRYQAKAPTSQRPVFDGKSHATVKPLALMRWLVRLVTPPGGLVLDPLCGTGTTGQAARDEGMRAVLIDDDLDSIRWTIVRLEKDA